ncbi:MAG: hypothetical protein LBF69_02090 [Prevotellaceae bacterium]|nr:hypothetical protein [Prevotellaceae bacterium]
MIGFPPEMPHIFRLFRIAYQNYGKYGYVDRIGAEIILGRFWFRGVYIK